MGESIRNHSSYKADYSPAGKCVCIEHLNAGAQRIFLMQAYSQVEELFNIQISSCLFIYGRYCMSVLAKILCAISGSPEITQ